jgi:hypothetical protein
MASSLLTSWPDRVGSILGVANYRDVYKLTDLRGPSGILVMFAEELTR